MGTLAGSGGSLFLRKGLVTAQVALSFLLLFGAGLFVRSLQNLRTTDPGVVLDNLVTFQLSPALNGYTDERGSQFYRDLLQRLRSAPGVKSAGQAAVSILSGDEWDSTMSVEGHKAADGEDMQAFMNALSPGYFQTMQIPVLEGRDFRESDQRNQFDDSAPDMPRVAIVNQKFARHFFKGASPLGKRLGFGGGPDTKLNIEIIGVVADSLYEGPREGVRRQVFIPNWGRGSSAIYMRTATSSSWRLQPDPQRGESGWIRRCRSTASRRWSRSSTRRCSPTVWSRCCRPDSGCWPRCSRRSVCTA